MRQPREAVIAVTSRCNVQCGACERRCQAGPESLQPEHMARLPRTLRDVQFIGGEPFLREDLAQFVRLVRRHCPRATITVTTNALLEEAIVPVWTDLLRTDASLHLAVNVEGIGEAHDRAVGRPGAFVHAMRLIKGLHDRGCPHLRFQMAVGPHNADQLLAVQELAATMDVELDVLPAPVPAVHASADAPPGQAPPAALDEPFSDLLAGWLRGWHPGKWRRALRAYHTWRLLVGRPWRSRCRAGTDFFFLQADGNLYACNASNTLMGNLTRDGFATIWRSPAAQSARVAARSCGQACWMTDLPHRLHRRGSIRWLAWLATNKLRAHVGLLRLSSAQEPGGKQPTREGVWH